MRHKSYGSHIYINFTKRWSITPTIFNDNFRVAGNQLLESDIVYVRDPLKLFELNDIQLQKLAILAHYSFKSFDYCGWLILEMERRSLVSADSYIKYIENNKEFD